MSYPTQSAATHLLPLFIFNDTATTELYTLSLHDALPILLDTLERARDNERRFVADASHELRTPLTALRGNVEHLARHGARDRKSTRLNSSHVRISYAVFCLKKKKILKNNTSDVLA